MIFYILTKGRKKGGRKYIFVEFDEFVNKFVSNENSSILMELLPCGLNLSLTDLNRVFSLYDSSERAYTSIGDERQQICFFFISYE